MIEDQDSSSSFHLPKISSVCYLTAANKNSISPPVKRRVNENNTHKIINSSFDNNDNNNKYINNFGNSTNINNNTHYHSNHNTYNTTNNTDNRKNNSSLYTLHCFYRLASEELSPAYRKQAVVEDSRTSEHASNVTDQQQYRLKKRGGGESNNTNKKHNKEVTFSTIVTRKKDNAKRKIEACHKFKNGARKRKERSVTMS